jgi:hypothetical protein
MDVTGFCGHLNVLDVDTLPANWGEAEKGNNTAEANLHRSAGKTGTMRSLPVRIEVLATR